MGSRINKNRNDAVKGSVKSVQETFKSKLDQRQRCEVTNNKIGRRYSRSERFGRDVRIQSKLLTSWRREIRKAPNSDTKCTWRKETRRQRETQSESIYNFTGPSNLIQAIRIHTKTKWAHNIQEFNEWRLMMGGRIFGRKEIKEDHNSFKLGMVQMCPKYSQVLQNEKKN